MDLSWLWGGNGQTFEPGQFGKSRPFPTKEDLEFARKYDAFYPEGEFTPNTFEATNENIGETNSTKGIRTLAEMGQLPNPTDQNLLDTLARNKLASRRSAIVSLGANDSRDNVVGAKDFSFDNFAGKTMQQDGHPLFSFFGAGDEDIPSTPTHEAAHRGIFKLIDEIANMENSEQSSQLREYMRDPDNNEYMVRALMNDLYDNPEKERMPERYNQFLNNPLWQEELDQARQMNQLAESIAQKMIQRRKPGGPW